MGHRRSGLFSSGNGAVVAGLLGRDPDVGPVPYQRRQVDLHRISSSQEASTWACREKVAPGRVSGRRAAHQSCFAALHRHYEARAKGLDRATAHDDECCDQCLPRCANCTSSARFIPDASRMVCDSPAVARDPPLCAETQLLDSRARSAPAVIARKPDRRKVTYA
jgi:hypothetical protein